MSGTTSISKLAGDLPKITRGYLEGLTADGQAALLRQTETLASKLREEEIRAEGAKERAQSEAEEIEAQAKADFGVSSIAELETLRVKCMEDTVTAGEALTQLLAELV